MNHKRRRPKKRRAGCALCKPHKQNGAKADGLTGGPHPVSARRRLQVEE